MKFPFLRSLVLIASLWSTASFAGLGVSPVKIEKSISAEDNELEFIVSNRGERPIKLSFATAPLGHDENGVPTEIAPGSKFDASNLIHFERDQLVLGPRRWKRIRARVDVPNRAGGGYALIYVRGEDAESSEKKTGVTSALQVGIVVALTYPNPGRTEMRVEAIQSKDDHEVRVLVRNEGDVHAMAAGRVQLKDATGKAVWEGELITAKIYPDHVRELQLSNFPSTLPSGDYTLSAELLSPTPSRMTQVAAVADGRIEIAPSTAIVAH